MDNESSSQWYIKAHDGKEYGPVNLETLKRWVVEKRILRTDLIKGPGMDDWAAASSVSEIKDAFTSTAPPAEPQPASQTKELLSIGELLKISWSIIKNNIVVLLGIAALYLVGCLTAISKELIFPVIIIDWVASIGLIFAINNILDGKTVNIKESYKTGLKKIFSYAWVIILVCLATVGGFLLLIIPGIIFFIWFGFAPYVCIIEGIGSTSALKRSKQLVKGNWWYVLWALLVCATVYGICICVPFGILYAVLGGSAALKAQLLRIAGGLAAIVSTAVYVPMFRNLRDVKG